MGGRSFREFAAGKSPIAIACDLNAEGVAGPSGKPWRDTSIRGNARRGLGIINNELYVGVRVWNHKHKVKDPTTGKDVTRLNPESEWIRKEVPDLRSEEHTSELQSLMRISYAVFCLKKTQKPSSRRIHSTIQHARTKQRDNKM